MKRFGFILLGAAALLAVLLATAQNHRAGEVRSVPATLYVSQHTGSNQNDGSKEAPFKNIQKAIERARPGDVIRVAEGNYFGLLDCGNIKIDRGVSIIGGYSEDFSQRDVLAHRTFIQPSAASNSTAQGQGTVQINVMTPGSLVELDGLILDRGNAIAYHPGGEGRPDGVETAMMQPIGTAGVGAPGVADDKVYTAETALVYIQTGSKCDITIRNCAFLNGPNYGIIGSTGGTRITIDNCIFVNMRMAAVELRGSNPAVNSETLFTHNTVLFAWSRIKDLGDMGYGLRFMPKMDSRLDRNIIGCCILSGLDRTRVDAPAEKEAERVTSCENTVFFLNRQADLTLPGGAKALSVRAGDFADVAQLSQAGGNREESDPAFFSGAVNEAYLQGFLHAEATTSGVTMFANHYPVEDALRLFGAVEGYGAQQPR